MIYGRLKMKKIIVGLIVFGTFFLSPALIYAQETKDKLEPADETQTFLDSMEKFIQNSKHPVPWMKWGMDLRMREIYGFNWIGLANNDLLYRGPGITVRLRDDDWHFQRWRLRWWATFTPFEIKDISINTRLVWEFRTYEHPVGREHSHLGCVSGRSKFDDSDLLFDILNVKWKNVLGLPLTLTFGRQTLIFGDGWLILDGTPLDGSRTIYFDAIRLTYDWKERDTKVDLIYIRQPADSADNIKPFNDQDSYIVEQDEDGVILYVTNKSLKNTTIEGYYIYKHCSEVDTESLGVTLNTESANIHTIGARVVHKLNDHIQLEGEFAQQTGHRKRYGDDGYHDICAFGFKGKAIYFLRDAWKNNFRVEYEYLSGDKSGTAKNEQFDPLWGRWPQWSELYVYTYVLETRIGEVTNLHRLGFGWNCKPMDSLDFALFYHLLWADEKYDNYLTASTGDFRGQLVTAKLSYKYGPHVSGHFLCEMFCPGDYYNDGHNDLALFLRYELVFTW